MTNFYDEKSVQDIKNLLEYYNLTLIDTENKIKLLNEVLQVKLFDKSKQIMNK